MGVPIVYRKTQEAAIASFNFTDIASATGYITYYGGSTSSGATVLNYALSNNIFYAHRVMTRSTTNSITFTKTHDLDFDIQFKLPQTVRGNIIANIPVMIYAPGVTGFDCFVHPYVRLRKWDGATETEIAGISGGTLNFSVASVNTYLNGVAGVSLQVPQTLYKKNETLRMTIELWTRSDGANTIASFVGHDPKNRATTGYDTAETGGTANTFGTEPSNLIIHVPFKLDL